mmetsp:Transcript_5315/g.12407  ORF Transcript_5315/g.12407 Transcript_5315/m.12407 type:complete len:306 (-) Transcript_5315:569-1486(-)
MPWMQQIQELLVLVLVRVRTCSIRLKISFVFVLLRIFFLRFFVSFRFIAKFSSHVGMPHVVSSRLTCLLLLLNRLYGLLGGVVEIVGANECQTGILQDLLAQLHVGSLQPDHHGNVQAEALGGLHDALRNDVAAHDAPKDIDQDGLDGRVLRDDLEGRLDLFGGGGSAHVQKVGGRAAVHRDNVHGGHGQSGAVDHAADLPVQTDVVEVKGGGGDLAGVLLRLVALGEDVLLPKCGVVVESDLGVGGDEVAFRVFRQRIDLDHGAVLVDEQLVEGPDLFPGVVLVAADAQAVDDRLNLLVVDSLL